MAHKKKTSSQTLDKANARLAGMKAIDVSLDLGDGVTVESYQTAINDLQQKQNDYNTTLSLADEKHNQMMLADTTVSKMTSRILIKVSGKYGDDSDEYEKVGGVRKSKIKRKSSPAKKAAA